MSEPTQRTPSRDLEAALVDAAERVLVQDGLRGLTVRAVATEAGVAPMGVYNRFGSKTGLIAAVLVRGFDGLADSIRTLDDADPLDRLSACGRSYRRFALANPQHYEAMFGSGASSADRAAAFSDETKGHATAAFGVLVDEVARAMDAGVLRRDDPREAAQVIWSAVHGAVALELAGVTQVDDPDASYERLLVALVAGLG
ncbi:MAG: TetR/AcrR family transcriptional regulator [Blastococcus sp.]|nr:TetR/AcrR family transcriptional regulator [Blastococcus sp.]